MLNIYLQPSPHHPHPPPLLFKIPNPFAPPVTSNHGSAPDDLTHLGRVTHICVSKLTIIGSDDALSIGRRQSIIWTNAGILLIGPLGTNFWEILIEIYAFSLKKIHLKMSEKNGHFVSVSMC